MQPGPGNDVDRWSIAHAASFSIKYTIESVVYIRIFQIWSAPVSNEELAGGVILANYKRRSIF